MDWIQLAVAAITSVGLWKTIETLLKLRHDKRVGVRQEDRADAALAATVQDQFVGRLHERVLALEDRIDELEEKRRRDAVLIRAQGDHIDLLEQHIWTRQGPPPPPRPATV